MKGAGQRALRERKPLFQGEATLLALDTALNAIDAPAIIVDLGGEVLHANTNARALLEKDRQGVARSLLSAISGGQADRAWELTPLRRTDRPRGFLAILRASPPETPVADLLQTANRRWCLTARQSQVLELVVRGFTNALIAETLDIGESTVEFHVSAIFDKAGVESRAMLIARVHAL
jgi:DNA-binding NarL/FixJ family response regulator